MGYVCAQLQLRFPDVHQRAYTFAVQLFTCVYVTGAFYCVARALWHGVLELVLGAGPGM